LTLVNTGICGAWSFALAHPAFDLDFIAGWDNPAGCTIPQQFAVHIWCHAEGGRLKKPWLTVIVPTYNGAGCLAEALTSVASQGDEDIEVIAIDDGSSDDTVAILKSFRDRLPMMIVERAHRGNWVASTNDGIARARGDYLCFLHQDDLWLDGRLTVLKRMIARVPQPVFCCHPAVYVDESGSRIGLWNCPLPRGTRSLRPETVVERLLVQNYLAVSAPLFKRELALREGGLDEELWYTADWDLWLKLAAASPAIGFHSEPLCAFRIHAQSQTIQRSRAADQFRQQLEVVLDRHLARCRSWKDDAVRRAARFSLELNVALAGWVNGQKPPWTRLMFQCLGLGSDGWRRYLRDSRIVERVTARMKLASAGQPRSVERNHDCRRSNDADSKEGVYIGEPA
jgi:hypothetical protein